MTDVQLIETDDGPRFVINGEEKAPKEIRDGLSELREALESLRTEAITGVADAFRDIDESLPVMDSNDLPDVDLELHSGEEIVPAEEVDDE